MCAIDAPTYSSICDIVRQRKHNAALGPFDAQSCYEQTVHPFTSMVVLLSVYSITND